MSQKLDQIGSIARLTLRHMKAHQPNRYRMLRKSGQLKEYLESVQRQGENYQEKAKRKGQPEDQTREVIRETWISLPDLPDPGSLQDQ